MPIDTALLRRRRTSETVARSLNATHNTCHRPAAGWRQCDRFFYWL